MAAFAVLLLLVHLLFAQLTFVLAVLFCAVSKTSRWRLWWLAVPVVAGLAWTLAIGPRSAAAGFTAGPAQILGYLRSGPLLDRLLHPHAAFAGAGGWLPRQFPLALIAAAAEAALVGWLDWVHTDEWAVRPPRPGVLAAARGALAGRGIRAGAVVTRDGCALGVAPDSGARVLLGWAEVAGGVLVTGADAQAVAVSSLQIVHAALRRRKPLVAVDLSGAGTLEGVLGAACAATGAPLRAAGEAPTGRPSGEELEGADLARVVRTRAVALFTPSGPDAAGQVCAGILALGEELRGIGVDGDGLVWLYGYEPPPDGPLTGLAASLVTGGTVGLPVLFTTTSRRAATELAGLVGVVLTHRVADPAMAEFLAARTGTRLVPAGHRVATVPPTAAAPGQAGFFQPAVAAMPPGMAVQPVPAMPPSVALPPGIAVQPAAAMQPDMAVQPAAAMPPVPAMPPGAAMAHAAAMPQAAFAGLPASGLVPAPAVPARTLLSLGPAEFVLAVSSPRRRLVALGHAVPARLPSGAGL